MENSHSITPDSPLVDIFHLVIICAIGRFPGVICSTARVLRRHQPLKAILPSKLVIVLNSSNRVAALALDLRFPTVPIVIIDPVRMTAVA